MRDSHTSDIQFKNGGTSEGERVSSLNSLVPCPYRLRLSTELTGHSGDVRAVVDLQTDEGQSVYVVTTSRD